MIPLMKISLRRVACGAVILSQFTIAEAAYDPAIVSAEARWVVHMDLNALRASTLGTEFVNMLQKFGVEADKFGSGSGTITELS